jgi:hypothetical protein
MSTPTTNTSQRKQMGNALERVANIEQTIPQLVEHFASQDNQIRQQLANQAEVVDALVGLLGSDVVADAIRTARVKKATEQGETRKANVAKAVAEKKLLPVETIFPAVKEGDTVKDVGAYVASIEFNPEGEEIAGSYHCLPMANVNEKFADKLVGLKVGAEVPVPYMDGPGDDAKPQLNDKGEPRIGKIVILGVYQAQPPKPPEQVAAEAAQPATETPPTAPSEAPAVTEAK